MQGFIETNWLTLASILIGFLVAFLFYRLQSKNAASAVIERKKHATKELLDVVESYVINKQDLSENVVDNLISASERDHLVELRGGCSPVSLLQDVALRLQRSRHLDIPQKAEYSQKIEDLIRRVREQRERPTIAMLQADLQAQMKSLQELIPTEHQNEAKKFIKTLTLLAEQGRDAPPELVFPEKSTRLITSVLLGAGATTLVLLTGINIIPELQDPMFADSNYITVQLIILATVALFSFLIYAIRTLLKNRTAKSKADADSWP